MARKPATKKASRKTATRKSAPRKSASTKAPKNATRKRAIQSFQMERAHPLAVGAAGGPPPAHARYRVVSIPNSTDVLVFTWDQASLSWDNGRQMSRADAHHLIFG